MIRHNAHVIQAMIINYNFLWDIFRGHCLKPEYGGFAKSGTTERLTCKLMIDDLNAAINKEKEPL